MSDGFKIVEILSPMRMYHRETGELITEFEFQTIKTTDEVKIYTPKCCQSTIKTVSSD